MREKHLVIINIVLVILAFFLLLNFLGVNLPSLGKAIQALDNSEPNCVVSFEGENSMLNDVDVCCYKLQEQLRCEVWRWNDPVIVEGEELRIDRRCYIGEGAVEYFVNMKQFLYCQEAGFFDYMNK